MELAAASVTRSIALDADVEDVWRSISDGDGLTGWLGDSVDLEVVPGAAGTVREGATVRRIVVTEVDAGRSIGFVWWDDSTPDEASTVTIGLAPGDGGTTTVTVTERLAGSASASIGAASIGDLVGGADAAWDARLQALVGACSFAAVCV